MPNNEFNAANDNDAAHNNGNNEVFVTHDNANVDTLDQRVISQLLSLTRILAPEAAKEWVASHMPANDNDHISGNLPNTIGE
ncbi:hypothetical protein [Kordiimonas sp. SCSIO 12610]|uniref:hypothetical protein n=1 Tax=Kordiimonas sp. SCSIO 12610 TaxID=2829597 RepID=UPI00210DB06F|nr:hypothetical protein [Kordiimonas sp. SCSIO 12610]UTW54525.1 hypothetical protein KFF44_12015 [Kordiimonas sp. SCSIO 12610]